MAGNYIVSSYQNKKVYRYLGFSSTVNASFAVTQTVGGASACWNVSDSNVYYSAGSSSNNSIKKGTGFTGTVQSSAAVPGVGQDAYDICIDINGNLYIANNNVKTYRMTGFSSTINASFTLASVTRGIAYDGTNALVGWRGVPKVAKMSGFSSTVTSSFTANTSSQGLTWDGTNVYTSSNSVAKHYQMTGFSSTIAASFSYITGQTDSTGKDWDGFPASATSIKTYDGLAIASVKTVDDLAIASVKNVMGLA